MMARKMNKIIKNSDHQNKFKSELQNAVKNGKIFNSMVYKKLRHNEDQTTLK